MLVASVLLVLVTVRIQNPVADPAPLPAAYTAVIPESPFTRSAAFPDTLLCDPSTYVSVVTLAAELYVAFIVITPDPVPYV